MLLEEIILSLCGGDTPPLGKKDTLNGVQGAGKYRSLHYVHSGSVVNSDFQKMRRIS